jgi:predicted RNase H-like nuclease (RuvC/YqgF family)
MAGTTVDSEALGQAAAALSTYINDVQQNIKKMQDSATDCSDNMGKDIYSQKAIEKLQSCVKDLSKTVKEAEDLQKRILKKKREVEDSIPNF